ncbi:MAG TPA: hypothetical protein VMZ30_11625 [Pyrinomonadaceae bacterium]|nr:hypothetical protein [Pyrinomonadaceae bacterium]
MNLVAAILIEPISPPNLIIAPLSHHKRAGYAGVDLQHSIEPIHLNLRFTNFD